MKTTHNKEIKYLSY